MERYQNVVRFGLFGHTHNEAIAIIKAISGNQENIGINFIAGSLTSYTDKNPSFTVIEIDEEFMVPINFKTYYYDIVKANAEGKITWEILHDFTNFYGLKDLRPDELASLSQRVRTNETLAMIYEWNKYRQSPATKPTSCDDSCRADLYCSMTSTEYFQHQICSGRPTFDWLGDPENALMNFMVNPWIKKADLATMADSSEYIE